MEGREGVKCCATVVGLLPPPPPKLGVPRVFGVVNQANWPLGWRQDSWAGNPERRGWGVSGATGGCHV